MRIHQLLPVVIIACAPRGSAPASSSGGAGPGDAEALAAGGAAGLRAISSESFEANTRYLSSDELEGRAPGSPGGAKAEQFIADQFAALGLAPAGSDGSYFQTVALREATRIDGESSLVVHTAHGDVAIEGGRDALLLPSPRAADVHVDAPLVFAGFGISRPDLGYDDLAGVDLAGAIAVVFRGAPTMIGGVPVDAAQGAVLADLPARTRTLQARGALAVLAVFNPRFAARLPFAQYLPKVFGPTMAWLDHGEPGSDPVLPTVTLDHAVFDRILGGGMQALWSQLDRGASPRRTLGATASLRIRSSHREIAARNVIGVLRGSDPQLSSELVIFTAHSDHIGIGPPVRGDRIYNGALDNASGSAALIEIARAFRAMSPPPRRSIAFAAVTAEEKGLLGSGYFVEHPTLPLDRIVADVNLDGVTVEHEPFDIVAVGAEHSSLGQVAAVAARATGFRLSPDPAPEQVIFIRSDQYSFVQHGIPSVFPQVGWLDAHGDPTGYRAAENRWSAEHYHQPSDEWQPEYRAAWGARQMQFEFLLGLSVASATERPRWNPGDAFGRPGGVLRR